MIERQESSIIKDSPEFGDTEMLRMRPVSNKMAAPILKAELE
jgi:hypothetical protein